MPRLSITDHPEYKKIFHNVNDHVVAGRGMAMVNSLDHVFQQKPLNRAVKP